MFIGENLNAKQIACLQAVADAQCGYLWASLESLHKVILNKPNILLDENDQLNLDLIDDLIGELSEEGLVDIKMIRDKEHVGLTEDGKRCNLIRVLDI